MARAVRTHCRHGHSFAEFGSVTRYYLTSAGTTGKVTSCKRCKVLSQKRENDKRKKVRRVANPHGKTQPNSGHAQTPDEQKRSLEILALIDAKWQASTVLDRKAIQDRIDALAAPKQ